jgi:hypothetical protein
VMTHAQLVFRGRFLTHRRNWFVARSKSQTLVPFSAQVEHIRGATFGQLLVVSFSNPLKFILHCSSGGVIRS